MFVAVDEENKQVFGPFSNEEKATSWARDYLLMVEGVDPTRDHPNEPIGENGEFEIQAYLWNIHEVQFVDEDDRDFGDWLGDQAALAHGGAEPAGFDEVQPRCDYCGLVQALEGEDWNGETGCHFSCEAQALAEIKERQARGLHS